MTRAIFARIALFAWAIFFGGNIAALLFVTALFKEHTRSFAGDAGGTIFPAFERLAIPTAAVLLVSLVVLRLTTGRGSATAAFLLSGLASITIVISTMFITPKINQARLEGTTQTPEFKKLHGRSMMLYSSQTLLLIATGILLPAAVSNAGVRVDEPAPVPSADGSHQT